MRAYFCTPGHEGMSQCAAQARPLPQAMRASGARTTIPEDAHLFLMQYGQSLICL